MQTLERVQVFILKVTTVRGTFVVDSALSFSELIGPRLRQSFKRQLPEENIEELARYNETVYVSPQGNEFLLEVIEVELH